MKLIEIETDKKRFLPLLLADEQESMIDRYIDHGAMWALDDGGIKAVCIVTAKAAITCCNRRLRLKLV